MRWFLAFLFLFATGLFAPAADALDASLLNIADAARTNLTVALTLCDQAVAANPTNLQPLALRARLRERAGRADDAILDLTAALKLEPKSAPLFEARGELNFRAGHFKESVADFDRFISFHPERAPHHWQRGISLYYAGRFADGRKQFESHQTVNPNDVENAAWHFLCAARERGVTNARAAIVPVGLDGRVPMVEINALYRGTGTVEEVLAAARRAGESRRSDAMFYAHLYLGLYFDALGDAAKAREHITLAASDPTATHYMGDVARVHLRTLKLNR